MVTELDPWALQIVDQHVARLVQRQAGFNASDVDDLKQDVALAILKRRLSPGRSDYQRCVHRTIHQVIRDAIRYRTAAVRDWRRNDTSLNVQEDADPLDFHRDRRTGRETIGPSPTKHAVDVVQDHLATLPPELLQAAKALLEEGDAAKAARRMGLSLSTFRNRFIKPLREHFAELNTL